MLSFLSYRYLKKEVQSGISHVQSKIPLFYNIYCILLPDFKDIKKSHISGNQKRNCNIFSPLLQGQMRVPALPVPQASPRAVSDLTTSILYLSSMLYFWIFIIHCRRLHKRTDGNSFYHTENTIPASGDSTIIITENVKIPLISALPAVLTETFPVRLHLCAPAMHHRCMPLQIRPVS